MAIIPSILNNSVLSQNPTYLKSVSKKNTTFYSSKILNYIESVNIGGFTKTVFYSEYNTNFNVGDRVFIINGNYDSNTLIEGDKYGLFSDGYRVLGVDGCRIILDIDYIGLLPYKNVDINISDSIEITHVSNQREFDYIDTLIVPLKTSSFSSHPDNTWSQFFGEVSVGGTVSLYNNQIIYSSGTFSNISSSVYPGFWIKDDISSSWIDISSQFISNNIISINPDYSYDGYIYITGEDFTFDNKTFRQRVSYKYSDGWYIDPKYKVPMISKLNFRSGKFIGTHNDGIFGTEEKSLDWNNGTWNSGLIININWINGIMNSKSIVGETIYKSSIQNGKVIQNIDKSNNIGNGLNFIIDSTFKSGTINNGNFENCNIGYSNGFKSLDNYYGITYSQSITVNGGQFYLCDIVDSKISNTILTNSKVSNSNIGNTKIINSQVIKSSTNNSEFNTDSGIKIIGSDIWSYVESTGPLSSALPKGILKLYISDDDLNKLVIGDVFYISKINKQFILSSLNKDEQILLPIETRFILDSYFDSFSSDKIKVSLKNKISNKYKVVVTVNSGITVNSVIENTINYSSIDIECKEFGYYYNDLESNYTTSIDYNKFIYMNYYNLGEIRVNNVNNIFLNCFISNGDFRKGVFENSKWISGVNINNESNKILREDNNLKFIPSSLPNMISVFTEHYPLNNNYEINDFDNQVGDYIWLNSITYATYSTIYGLTSVNLDGRYKIVSCTSSITPFSYSQYDIEKVDSDLDTFTLNLSGGSYYTSGATQNSYVSINNFYINNSTINSGLFKKTSICNSTFINNNFDNFDKNLTISNIEKLRIVNTIFSRTNNNIKSGLLYKSHFVDGTFTSGIIYNSIWNGGHFLNGIANNITWLDGTFSNGYFLNSSNLDESYIDYDLISRKKVWFDGIFNLGYFEKSTWLKGTFNNGRFYNSTWYGGIWNNGILGLINLPTDSTKMGYMNSITNSATYTIWKDGVVENAIVGGSSSVYWYNGKFNNGEFISYGTSSTNESIWYNGKFSGGKFSYLARWKNGEFDGGRFDSYYGLNSVSPTQSSNQSSDYGWEYGKFNGGEFGNASTATNSVWFNGEFNGGIFQGKYWKSGLLRNGTFNGSGISFGGTSSLTEFDYANSFTSSYYGIWNDGWVTESISNNNDYQIQPLNTFNGNNIVIKRNQVKMNNILWKSGTFSHEQGVFNNSLWLGGSFNKGSFDGGVFNPFIDRDFTGVTANSSFNTQSSVWNDGVFKSGTFYLSEWKKGIFQNGLMSGAIWRNGTWNYGTAENIYWEDGLWRNGNWDGTPFDIKSLTSSNQAIKKASMLMSNIAQFASSSNIHIINAFSGTINNIKSISPTNTTVGIDLVESGTGASWTYSTSYTSIGSGTIDNLKVITSGFSKLLTVASASSAITLDPLTKYTISFNALTSTSNSTIYVYYSSTYSIVPVSVWPLFTGPGPHIWPLGGPGYDYQVQIETSSSSTDLKLAVYSPTSVTTNLFNLRVDRQEITYNSTYNNELYSGVSASIGSTVSLPISLTELEAVSDYPANNSYQKVSIKFGNGIFKSGVWENGVWNNGWRDDTTITKFIVNTSVNYISLNKTTHRMFLTIVDDYIDSISQYKVGNWVSCGNLIGIDIDEKRVLLWNKFRIVSVGSNYIIVEYINTFPLKRIEVDSFNHIVYVSKNLWMSGVFLNGYFSGIWNSGWFKGYPYLTKMNNTYWVDGKFEGGHFISTVDSYTFAGVTYSYNTGLIQNINFKDNNVDLPYYFTYQSWLDLNYTEESQSNFYRDQYVYEMSNGLNKELPRPNLNGPITSDILSGVATFRNGYNSQTKEYVVGTKYNILQDYLEDIGTFDSTLFSNQISSLGLEPFTTLGWTMTSTNGIYSTPSISGTYTVYPDRYKLYNTENSLTIVSSDYAEYTISGSVTTWPSGDVNALYLDNINDNILSIPKGRYSMIEFDLATWSGQPGAIPGTPRSLITSTSSSTGNPNYYQPAINYTIFPATWSINKMFSNPIYNRTGPRTDYTKKEYFYNRNSLLLQIYAGNVVSGTDLPVGTYPFTASFDRISFYEIDRIPFFQYTTESNVDQSIQAPWMASAPYIDFSRDFVYNNYLSNVSFRLDSTSLGSVTSLPPAAFDTSIYTEMISARVDTSGL